MKTVSYFGRIYKCLPIRYNRNKGNFRFPKGEVTMKNNRKPIFWRRGLALLLAVCLAAGYVPVPGYAEGCTHAHGEDCYEVTTQCVHSHDESCYMDPVIMEAGEEPDACAHACAEETGCVTKALNCAHVHDAACGEAAEEEPKEEPQPEGKEEPKEEPKPQKEPKEEPKPQEEPKEEPKTQEEPKEEPEAPQEPQAKTVTAWTWLDEEEALDPETGKLCLVASEEAPVFLDQIVEVLPQAIEATVDGEGETLPVAAWTCGEYPEDGAYEGSFVLEAELPEGYALGDGVEALHVAVEFGGAVTLGDCPHSTVNQTTGACESCGQVLYDALVTMGKSKELYTSLAAALNAASSYGKDCTVLILRDVTGEDFYLAQNTVVDGGGHRVKGCWRDPEGKISNITLLPADPNNPNSYSFVKSIEDPRKVFGENCAIQSADFAAGYDSIQAGILQDGFAFFTDEACTTFAQMGVYQCEFEQLYTGPHSHDFQNWTTNVCQDCGYVCTHANASLDTGVCPICAKRVYQAKIGTTGYATLDAALTEAQKTEGSTVKLLCDVSEEVQITGGNFTLDLNGRTINSSGTVIRLYGGALTLTDSGTGGRVTGNAAVYVSDGELNIQGGTYASDIYGLYVNTYSASVVSISGGAFEKIGLASSVDGSLVDCLAPNHAFYADPDGKTIVNAAVKDLSGPVYVREHTHDFDADGVCPCGYQCPHTEAAANLTTGKCACGKVQVYKAKIGDTGYGSLGGAMNAAEEKPGCTVTLLCDVSNEDSGGADTLYVRSGSYTLDLNGHKIERTEGMHTFGIDGSLTVTDTAGGGQITNTCGKPAIDVNGGSLTIQGGTIGGDVTATKAATLTISGGAFMGKLRHTWHALVEDLADGCAFYADPDGKTIVSGAAEELTGPVYVRKGHNHHYVNGKCDCGQCSHISVDMDTGKCAQCGYQVYLAKVGKNQGYATLREAFSAAVQTPNSTVTLLADVNVLEEDTNYCYVLDTGTFTLNLNGRKIINDNRGREIFRLQGANLTIEGHAPGSEIRRAVYGMSAIELKSGSLTIRGGEITGKSNSIGTSGGKLTISGGTFDGSLYISAKTTAAISGGSFSRIATGHDSLLDVLAPDYAFFDADSGKILDASGQELENVCVREHTHRFDANGKCQDCGYVCSHANVDMTTGKCAACSKQLYQAKIGTKGYATLDAALTEAQETENSTVTVLCDIALSETAYFYLAKGTFTLDLNGHKLAQPSDMGPWDDALFRIAGADITIEGRTAGSEISDSRLGTVVLMSGKLSIHGGKIRNVTWVDGELTITDGEFGKLAAYADHFTAAVSGGTFKRITYGDDVGRWEGSLLTILKSGYAFFDVDSKKVVDASGQKLENVYVHTHTKRQGYKTCACGYTFPYATVTKAPEPLKLTYTGQPQTLVTQGTAEGGEMLYSLEKDGYYGKTVPFGIVKTYTVYYMVRGDSGHLDTEPESVTVTIKPTKRLLDLTGLNLAGDITIDGVDYPIEASNDTLYVTIPETGDLFTYYGYKNIWASNEHSNYPTSMSVYAIERTPTGSTARKITELQDLLTYAGCSIRISGKQGIRMITALDEATKKALTGKGLAGYTLEEYGTVVSWTNALGNGSFLRLGEAYARFNYAYRKGEADPVFARKNGIIQYTNVLVLENLTEADYDKDLTLRAYIRLRNTETGETVTLYGGTVTRSIYYVAKQNADTYKPGTAGHKFVHKIIDTVENRT